MIAPRATYRLQLHAGFTFDDAASVVPYLAALGISHLYCSPVLQAVPGSTHGYDVVDHSRLSLELGGDEGFERLARSLADHGMSLVLDIVPNHMAIAGPANRWWWDVLENGPSSLFAAYFDIDWDPPEAKLRQMVLLPVLEDHYGRVLEAGELAIERRGAAFHVRYHEPVAPVSPRTLDDLLARAAAECGSEELAGIADFFGRLPPATATDRASVEERHRHKEVLRNQLERLLESGAEEAAAVDGAIAAINADPDALDALLSRQNYRLAFWRVAGEELDYRRFFDIPSLVALRVEEPDVFEAVHRMVLGLVRGGVVSGLRVDHPDGLRRPAAYIRRLADESEQAYITLEKILEVDERLPSWPVAGTTGYDFLNVAGGLFVDPDGERPLTDLYAEFTGRDAAFETVRYEKKHEVLREVLAADLSRLTNLLASVCERHRRYRDYTRHDLRQALREVVACFPVYRTYLAPGQPPSARDVAHIEKALTVASANRPEVDPDLFAFLGDLLLMRVSGKEEIDLALRFQQLTGPAMAKGVEDTGFYCFNRLVSLNEVGGDPGRFGVQVDEFHRHNERVASEWPATMLTTATHDTKRGEDVRLRVSLLSEIPDEWEAAVRRWSKNNDRYRAGGAPDPNDEYLLYQTLVGAHPLDSGRAVAYMEKATREAKEHTSWLRPDGAYDSRVRQFVEAVLGDESFTDDLAQFCARLARPAEIASLAQTLLKLTSPGVPDLYQGTELWDLSLVDPDNRRPVDFDGRARKLTELEGVDAGKVWPQGGPAAKLWLISKVLGLRRQWPSAFGPEAGYTPLTITGERAGWGVAYMRGDTAVTLVPLRPVALERHGWGQTLIPLPPGPWVSCLTGAEVDGGSVPVARLLEGFPVALVTRR